MKSHGKKIAVLKVKIKTLKQAIKLQAKEYERRLQGLNHEAEQLKDMQSTYLPRAEFSITNEEIKKELKTLTAFRDNSTGKNSIISGVVAAVVSILMLGLNYILNK